MRVLLVEDNPLTAKGLTYLLEREGYVVAVAGDAVAARELISSHTYQLALIDVGLPDDDGFAVAREVREQLPDTAMIFLTAYDDEASVVRGFELGADDYVTKPFRNRELLSRMQAVLRRHGASEEVRCGALTLTAGRLEREGVNVPLSALEYQIVAMLMRHAGQIVPRERLLDEIWDHAGNVVNDNTLTVYIKRIREKIGEEAIQTVKGIGYRM